MLSQARRLLARRVNLPTGRRAFQSTPKRKNMMEEAKARIAKVKMKKKIQRIKKQRKKKEYLQRDELVLYPVQ